MQPPRQEKLLSEEVRRVAETQFRKLSDWKAQSQQVLSDFEKQNNAGKTAEHLKDVLDLKAPRAFGNRP